MVDKIKRIDIEKVILISIMILLIGVPVITYYSYTCYCFNLWNFPLINRVNILWWGVPFLIVLYILDLIINKKKITLIDILVYLLIILGILSTVFAVDTNTSIYGEYARNEGLLSLLSYYFILLNLKNLSNENYKSILLKTLLFLGIGHIIYGLLQVYTDLSIINHYKLAYMASGLCGNPNFFGSYMVIVSSFTFSMYMLERKKRYLVLLVIFFMGLCLSSSTGPFISFLLVMVFFVIYYRKKIKWLDLLKIMVLLVSTYFLVDYSVNYVHKNIFGNRIDVNYNITSELQNLDVTNLGNGRMKLWKESLPLVKKYWVIGAGLDNFKKVYYSNSSTHYDKAHNVYLQIAITNGLFALILYMILIMFIFFKGLKIKDKVYIAILMAFIGYSIQAFANISVIEVAPTFFAISGLLLGKIKQESINEREKAL